MSVRTVAIVLLFLRPSWLDLHGAMICQPDQVAWERQATLTRFHFLPTRMINSARRIWHEQIFVDGVIDLYRARFHFASRISCCFRPSRLRRSTYRCVCRGRSRRQQVQQLFRYRPAPGPDELRGRMLRGPRRLRRHRWKSATMRRARSIFTFIGSR